MWGEKYKHHGLPMFAGKHIKTYIFINMPIKYYFAMLIFGWCVPPCNFVLLKQGNTYRTLACSRCFFFFLNGAQMLVRIKVTPNTFYIAIFQTEWSRWKRWKRIRQERSTTENCKPCTNAVEEQELGCQERRKETRRINSAYCIPRI